jgi:hypothetical protein
MMQNLIWDFESRLIFRLAVWSILSVLSGLFIWFLTNEFGRGFGIQCVTWGLIDLIIAFFGARSASRRKSTANPKSEAQTIRRILWVNFGLDIFYLIGGYWVMQNYPGLFWQGAGWGIILQGLFLFFFDLVHALRVPIMEAK